MKLSWPKFKAKSTYHTGCDTLPIGIFIRILTGSGVELLTISGKPESVELDQAWNGILSEYGELSNTVEYQAGIHTIREYGLLKARYTAVVMATKVLSIKYDKDCVEVLKHAGYNYEFSDTNVTARMKDLDLVNRKAKTIRVQLEQKAVELEAMNKNSKPVDAKQWADNIATISKFMGFRIDVNVVTVSEYVGYQRQLMHFNELNNAKNATAGTD